MGDMPRVLVISNTALKRSNSNGDTILSLLSSLPSENIMSFYLQNAVPDKGVAKCSFRITDKERMRSFFNGKNKGTLIRDEDITDSGAADSRNRVSYRESFFAHDIRAFIWKHGRWDKSFLYQCVDGFRPTVIMILASRTSFMLDIATEIADKRGLPIIMLTGENEYFRKPKTLNLWDHIFRRKLRRSYWNMMPHVTNFVVTNDKIAEDYEAEFHKPIQVLMPSIKAPIFNGPHLDGHGLIYGGNLEPYRYESLEMISEALIDIDPAEIIHVYSGDVSPSVKKRINKCPNVKIHDPISKDKLIKRIQESRCVLHFESFGKKAAPLIQNAFSGKIAECISSGVPFFVFAPNYCAFSPYFTAHLDAVDYVMEPAALKQRLARVLSDAEHRQELVEHAIPLVGKYHNEETNSSICLRILHNTVQTGGVAYER